MSQSTRVVLLLAVLVTLGGIFAVGAVVASDHVDTLAGDDDDVIEDFNASDEQYFEYTLDADGADFGDDETDTVILNVTYDDVEHFEYEEDVDEGDESYTFNVSHAALETVPGGAEETTTVDVVAVGYDDDGNQSTGPEEFELDITFDSTHAAIYVHDADDDDFATFDEEDGLLGLDFLSSSHATIDDDIAINGSETEIQIHVADSDVSDEIDASTEDVDDGDRVALMMASTVDGSLVYVYADEPGETIAGDDVEDEDYSYIVVHDDDHATIHIGDDLDDEDEVSINVVANDLPGAADLRADLDYGFLQSFAASSAWIPTGLLSFAFGALFAGGLVAHRRQHVHS